MNFFLALIKILLDTLVYRNQGCSNILVLGTMHHYEKYCTLSLYFYFSLNNNKLAFIS